MARWPRSLAGTGLAAARLLGRQLYTERAAAGRVRGSLFVRHVDGGSSNVAELELTALMNALYDIEQYGIQFVVSPRHADVMLLTGPLTRNLLAVAQETFRVMAEPKAIVTVGDALSGRAELPADGIGAVLAGSYATVDLPADLRDRVVARVPGDPPEPAEILQALLSLARDGLR
jgi:Ni,Fe-hydrogenase III small subunit